MKVAITCMEDVGDAEVRVRSHLADGCEQKRKGGAGDYAILHDVVGRDAADGGEGSFTAFPDKASFYGRLGNANLPCSVLFAEGGCFEDLRGYFGFRAIEFDQEKSFADGIVGMDGGFRGHCGEAIHHLESSGEHSGGDDVGDGLRCGSDGVECGE